MRALGVGLVLLAASAWAIGGEQVAPTEAGGALPAPKDNAENRLEVKSAARCIQQGTRLEAEGDVHITFAGYDIMGDRVVGDTATRVFTAEGHGRLEGKTEQVRGDVVTVDLRNETFRFENGRAKILPGRTGGRTAEDVFFRGQRGEGKTENFDTHGGSFTSCNQEDHPHFQIDAESTNVKPGKRAVLRMARLRVLGQTLLRVPVVTVPLLENGERYIPEFGQSPDEGYYAKTRISTPLRGESFVDTHVDLYSKLGAGLGQDLNYGNRSMAGVLSVYGLVGSTDTLLLNARHKQRLLGGDLILDGSFQRDNYLTAPDTKLLNTRAQYATPWQNGSTRLGYTRVQSDTTNYRSANQTISVTDQHRWTPRLSTQVDANLTRNESVPSLGESSTSERVDLRFLGRQEFRSFSAELLYQRSVPVGEQASGFYGASDRTPYLTVRTDARKLFGEGKAARALPFQGELSWGELADPTGDGTISKLGLDLSLRKEGRGRGGSGLRYGGRFVQGVYSDDTAQFVGSMDAAYGLALGRDSMANLTYRYVRPQGYTPLAVDRTARNDALAFDVTSRVSRALTLSAQTGYDLLQADQGEPPWQQVFLRSEWTPGKDLRFRTQANYDTFSNVWGQLRFDFDWRQGSTRYTAAARYDGRRCQWAGGSLCVQGFRTGKVTASMLWDYNGYTEQLDAQHYSLVYDLHCAEVVFEMVDNAVGFRSGRQFGLYLRLKAFPFATPFGTGQRGQAIGASNSYDF